MKSQYSTQQAHHIITCIGKVSTPFSVQHGRHGIDGKRIWNVSQSQDQSLLAGLLCQKRKEKRREATGWGTYLHVHNQPVASTNPESPKKHIIMCKVLSFPNQ